MKLLVLLLVFVYTAAVKLPPNFKKCSRKQPDFKQCVLDAASNGIKQLTKDYPALNLPSLNPFVVTKMELSAGTIAFIFTNCSVFGIDDAKFDRFEIDLDEQVAYVDAVVPKIELKGHYEAHGKISVLPLEGNGLGRVTLDDAKFSVVVPFQEQKRRTKTYLKFSVKHIDLKPKSMSFNLENLLSSGGALNDNMNQVLTENWESVYEEIGGAIKEFLSKLILTMVNGFFSKVSKEEALE